MDKEMMAKVNEVLKAHGKRELNMNEMEQVTGGQTCKRDGVYYIDLIGIGEFPLTAYGELLDSIKKDKGVDVAIEFANALDPNPHNEELLRYYGAWGVVDHWERSIDGKNNGFEI